MKQPKAPKAPLHQLELDDDDELEASPEEALAAAADEEAKDELSLASDPLFSTLLQRTLAKTCPDDAVLRDYVALVVPQLSLELAHHTAKGGDFAAEHRKEGRERAADYSYDQSLRAHLINGLLPAAQVARALLRWGVPSFEDDWDATSYRLFCAGYTLHDWGKVPEVQAELVAAGLEHNVSVAQHLPLVEDIFLRWVKRLGLDRFLAPLGDPANYLHDLIFIASNTQRLWGTLRNLAALPNLRHGGRSRELATSMSTLADLLAYVGRTPVEAASHPSIAGLLEQLSGGRARLSYHHLSEVRGVLTNLINNAAMAAYLPRDAAGNRLDLREPLLYAPSGVVYLEHATAPPPPAVALVADDTVERMRELCRTQIQQQLIGFKRGGKGLKWADYYWLFFTPRQFAMVAARAAMVRINSGGKGSVAKQPSAPKRFAKMREADLVPPGTDLDLPADLHVDRVAELCNALAMVAAEHAPQLDVTELLLATLGLRGDAALMQAIPAKGGTPYPWYYIAGRYRQRVQGLSEAEWEERLQEIAAAVAEQLPDELPTRAGGWDALRRYVHDHLRFAGSTAAEVATRCHAELARYSGARKSGHGSTRVCSLCTAPYEVTEQRESAILFAPQVYTNKQPLHGSKAIRHICAVCGLEMMLRQVLMKRGQESGGDFEKRRLRYLFFYPTYFFTSETLGLFRELQTELRRMSFTSLRKLLVPEEDGTRVDVRFTTFQRLPDLLLDPKIRDNPDQDRLFRLHYSEREPMTFFFLGIPPTSNDAKDAEAWVHPAFLALILPLLVDVKVVASESMLPLLNEANELIETVAFDGAHAFVNYLVQSPRLNLDALGRALQRLTVAYLIHLDGNAKVGAGGYDYNWKEIAPLARRLAESPLYAFYYLKKWQRREGLDSYSERKAALYLDMVTYLAPKGDPHMSHARELTMLYRQFYRAEKLNSNAILRPISIAARVMLDADLRLFADDDALAEAVFGKLRSFMENVERNRADGRLPKGSDHASRDEAMRAFSVYMVQQIYRQAFGGDRAALRGMQLNLLKNACEAIYLDAWRQEKARSQAPTEEESEDAA
ncbi:MAG: type I-D CRISPR-associated protein Cas10d/Csc3 [Candidatus Viridilinea halotolerans]|uniref:Type I-D CRISPR-associated protein Cas10d/Csc3 n=1 Tax=Candidatus Viridilinea halotolerans TaxID=2491704 RepID=A0A426TU42_9CHLR|nr:MAG: type I-D CRISPR-associated protein Cas10d/Csc3 [Candidatus Viridilinea halotolerans]